jgi:hypothetical protein
MSRGIAPTYGSITTRFVVEAVAGSSPVLGAAEHDPDGEDDGAGERDLDG